MAIAMSVAVKIPLFSIFPSFCDFYSRRGLAEEEQKFLHSLLFIRVTATVAVKRSLLTFWETCCIEKKLVVVIVKNTYNSMTIR